MCTLTWVPRIDATAGATPAAVSGYRIAFNRDEQRTRPAGLPPVKRRFGAREALLPIDPVGGGTWIAVNDAGVALALLNVYSGQASAATATPSARLQSRGLLIPALLHAPGVDSLAAAARRIDASQFAPFRLAAFDPHARCEARSDGRAVTVTQSASLPHPLLLTSSGLGDHVVQAPRRELFERSFSQPAKWPDQQDAFHRHSWPDRPHLSICMRRAEACTVSRTIVTVTADRVELGYHGAPPDEPALETRLFLPRRRESA